MRRQFKTGETVFIFLNQIIASARVTTVVPATLADAINHENLEIGGPLYELGVDRRIFNGKGVQLFQRAAQEIYKSYGDAKQVWDPCIFVPKPVALRQRLNYKCCRQQTPQPQPPA